MVIGEVVGNTCSDATYTVWNGPVGGTLIASGILDTGQINPFNNLPSLITPGIIPTGSNRLTPWQISYLIGHHDFIEMQGSDYCLLCFALDLFRVSSDHRYVIHEE